jgi:hypothetical protein
VDNVRRLWTQLTKELVQAKKRSIATMLGGSQAHLDSETEGLLIELPDDAAFNKQQLERLENKEQLSIFVQQVFGSNLPVNFILGAPVTPVPTHPDNLPDRAQAPSSEPPLDPTQATQLTQATPFKPTPQTEEPASSMPLFESEESAPSIEDILSASFGASISVDEVPPR